ncbi:valine--tRNA ligase [Pseudoroseicyclus aestuarii]|uniref:Valine--tRNA ligase n=1 Tax=Pseudoroseicyclus aestuarii TaxID=1795041 RepID=A0A318SU20_9RHOB|nr:valine--tRNA ligase [Pseudoroseicyclus aestuarii]PYE85461.1 valyl-tRNA synthetase [Pseudoroseicyclus aestuarii]
MAMEKTFDAKTAEARISQMWEQAGAFRAGANASRSETFSIVLPPPNVTGFLHAGHAFNHTLMDILTRWHRMRGFDTLWQPGLDHAGIATQLVVERELAKEGGETRREMGREKFVERVRAWKDHSGGTIIRQDRRLGSSMDYDREVFTMDGAYHDAVIRVFREMFDKGLIYRGKRLVNWDPHFETAISDLEVENTEVAGHMWHFKYPLAGGETYEYVEKDEDGTVTLRETRDYISIATTRPETMLGDGAVAVHPSDERYAPIVGKFVEIPVGPKEHRRLIPIITDSYPDPTFGSGAVKITGAHDFNDYGVAQRNGIPLYALMDTKGAMRADGRPYAEEAATALAIARGEEDWTEASVAAINLVPDELRGLDRAEAREAVVAQITDEGLAVMTTDEEGNAIPLVENKPIMQPFGDRSKVVIEPMLTDQWFVDTAKIVGPALDAVRDGRVRIMPESGEKVYYHWLENIEPWCISRQLWWGHRIPVWYGLDLGTPVSGGDGNLDDVDVLGLLLEGGMVHTGAVMHTGEALEEVTSAFQDEIADLPSPLSHARVTEVADRAEALDVLAQSLADYATNQDPSKLVYPVWRDPDVLDTWFSSGLWPIGTMGWPEQTEEMEKYFPSSVLVTGQDILFFWVARMMMMQLATVDEVPFHDVYLHQLVRDEKGVKMSKVLGNVIDPIDIIDEFGADALRFANAQMAAMGGVLKLSLDRIKGTRNFGTKLWNACRFAEMNGVWEGHATQTAAPAATAPVNRWILAETAKARAEVDAALTAYRFNEAANTLYAFTWGVVCDWYVEFAKPLLMDGDEATKAETRAVMAYVLDRCMILLHPFMPFITEELWQTTGNRPKMLVHADRPEDSFADPAAEAEMRLAIAMIDGVRSARAQMNVPASLEVPVVLIGADAQVRQAWEANAAMIRRLAKIGEVTEAEVAPRGAITVPLPGATLAMPLADLIDAGAEKARLEKSLAKLDKEIRGLEGRANNPKFAASAPEEVVAETRANLAARMEERARLAEAIARLDEIA